MITLYQFPPMWGLPNVSPFCLKVETYLRMMGMPYEIKHMFNTQKAPKGKLPFIKDHGKTIPDSNFIIEYLQETYGNPLEEHLSDKDKAIIHALRRMLDENTYWVGVYTRWVMEENWEKTKESFFGKLKAPYRWFIPKLAKKNILNQLHQHGIGRHSEDEIFSIACKDLEALSAILGDDDYFVGSTPTTLDASAFALLVNLFEVPIESPVKDYAERFNNLKEFCNRMKERYYSDWGKS